MQGCIYAVEARTCTATVGVLEANGLSCKTEKRKVQFEELQQHTDDIIYTLDVGLTFFTVIQYSINKHINITLHFKTVYFH